MRRDEFKTCIDTMTAIDNAREIIEHNIFMKTGINCVILKGYLTFLENKGYVCSRKQEENKKWRDRKVKAIYSLEPSGYKFLKGWEDFRKRFDIKSLEEQLQSIDV